MTSGLAVAGWVVAACGGAGVAVARRRLSARMERTARACHELRGPITAARLGLELGLRRGVLSPARLRALDLELGRAALAIDDLAGAAVPAGRREEFELRRLLGDSVEAWRGSAEARGTTLRYSWAGPPVLVSGDRLRLARATGNLIANAIEHGGERVDVCAEAGPSARATTIRIEFIDDGPGLPAPIAELARRGRRCRRAHGHGLAVAAEVVRAHGGRLAAMPSERGARIMLELPIVARQSDLAAANFSD